MSEKASHPEEPLSRRELLKKLGAAGAILGARAIVPTNWARPEIETGNLPVHAQTSGLGTVTGNIWEGPFIDMPSATRKKPSTSSRFMASIVGTALSVSPTYVGFGPDPNNQNNFYDMWSFSIPNVPFGARTVKAHDSLCSDPDQTQGVTVGSGSNAIANPFIFSTCV
ncbi:MAG: hypothetical protein HZB53_03550 [Chloroflexi bacterium]|nr:hypothetical protein [Chloroflexota bacterium]